MQRTWIGLLLIALIPGCGHSPPTPSNKPQSTIVVDDSAERDTAAVHKDAETTPASKEVSQDKVVVAKDKLSQLSLLPGWRNVEESTKGLEFHHQEHEIQLYVDSTLFSDLGDDVTFQSYKTLTLKLLDGPNFSLMEEEPKSMRVGIIAHFKYGRILASSTRYDDRHHDRRRVRRFMSFPLRRINLTWRKEGID